MLNSFIPELWAARLLANLEEAHVATAFVNRDYEGEIRQQGDTVHVNTLGPVTIKDYDSTAKASGIAAPETLDTTDQTLVIDQAKYYNFKVDDIDRVQAAGPLMDQAMHNAAFGLAHEIDTKIFSTISAAVPAANIVEAGEITADNVYGVFVKLRNILNKSNAPKEGRKVACSTDIVGLLLLDDRFVKSGLEAGENRLVNGLVARAAGFDIYETEDVPTGEIIATVPMATSFAEQITETEAYRPENGFADAVKGLEVYGVKTFYPKACAKVTYSTDKAYYIGTPDYTQQWDVAVATPIAEGDGVFEHDNTGYFLTQDTAKVTGKQYYNLFESVETPTGNPSEQGWYEPYSTEGFEGLVETSDTTVQAGKSYYTKVVSVG